MWTLPPGSLGAGRPAEGPGAAVDGPGGPEPSAAGQAPRDRRDVRLLDGILPVQPGGDAVALPSNPAGTASMSVQVGRPDA